MKRTTRILLLNILVLVLGSLQIEAQHNCGTQVTEEQQNYMNKVSKKRDYVNLDVFSKKITTIPIVPHIIQTHFGKGGLSEEDLTISIKQLNESFAPLNFKFESCGTKYVKNNAYYNELQHSFLKSSNEFKMADSDYVDGAVNIFFVPNPVNKDGNSICGWAYFPGSSNDWIVMGNNCAINGSTLAHEMGHYFKLYHTHRGTSDLSKNEFVDGSNCGEVGIGDEICDTPAEPYLNEKGENGQDKCTLVNCVYACNDLDFNGDVFKPDASNLMSYAFKDCRKNFSPDQIERMQTSYLEDRKYLAKECSSIELNTCKARNIKALLALYNATDGANWNVKWDLDQPIETWHGVGFNDEGCVDSLTIFSNNLNGKLPPEIGDLKYLEYLIIIGNNLSGVIPSEIGKLTQLKQLNLQRNGLEGGIPPEIKYLTKLEYFDLQINNLTGVIPNEIGRLKNLETLILSLNKFVGSLPVELINISNLNSLHVRNNNLIGCYEPTLNQLCRQMIPKNFAISYRNKFDASWEDFCHKKSGSCTCNRKSDSLVLVTFYNSTEGSNWEKKWDLKKPMDTWHGVSLNDYGCVNTLAFDNNNLKGTIPSDIGNLNYLENFTVFNDKGLVGSIPTEVGKLANLKILKLALNRLEGNIPAEIGNLHKLETLDLEFNSLLNGQIPSEIGNLSRIKTLKLSKNRLTGSIPVELSNLSNLNFFALSYNQLSGCYKEGLRPICDNMGSLFYQYVSNRNNFDADFDDFCYNDAGICNSSKFQRGDFNNDGIVNNVDAIYLGLAHGDTGSTCEDEDIENCANWESEVNGINGKYQDGDNNGIISEADLHVLNEYYGTKTTSKSQKPVVQDFNFKLSQVFKSPEQLIFELYVEDSQNQNIETHGLACSINFGELAVTEVEVDYQKSALKPTITLEKFDEVNNILDIALTRTDSKNILCNGYLAKIIISLEEVEIDKDYIVTLLRPSSISATGIHSNGEIGVFDSSSAGNKSGSLSNDLIKYLNQNKPNPFSGQTIIQYFIPRLTKDANLKVYNLTGNLLQSILIKNKGTGNLNISSKDLKAGLYIYTLEIDGMALSSKRMIIH